MPEIAVIPVIATQVVSNKNVPLVAGALLLLLLASILLSVWRAVAMMLSFLSGYVVTTQPRRAEPTPVIEAGRFYEALHKPRSW